MLSIERCFSPTLVIDGNVIAEYDAAGALLTEYVWMDDRPIAVIANAGSGSPVIYWPIPIIWSGRC